MSSEVPYSSMQISHLQVQGLDSREEELLLFCFARIQSISHGHLQKHKKLQWVSGVLEEAHWSDHQGYFLKQLVAVRISQSWPETSHSL